MIKFQKDGNKIKQLKIRKGIPLFINYCYNQGIRNKLYNSKLFVENNELHYHTKYSSGFVDNNNTGAISNESVQYIIKSIDDYSLDPINIFIKGNIERTKNGLENKPKIVNEIKLYRIYQNESELLKYLDSLKRI